MPSQRPPSGARPPPGPATRPSRSVPPTSPTPPTASARPLQPLSEREFDELQILLDRVPAPFEPLDICALDGYLCGVLLQPKRLSVGRWWPHVVDVDGRALPPSANLERLRVLTLRRHAELDAAITQRQWFDPWVFELSDAPDDEPGGATDDIDIDIDTDSASPLSGSERGSGRGSDADADRNPDADTDADADEQAPSSVYAVLPWVAGFVTAMECFPGLMALDDDVLTEPLALIYRHLAADDLEDADALLTEIESLEPPQDLAEAVEGLVRATLLLADVSRPAGAAFPSSPGASSARPPAKSRPLKSQPPRRGRP